MSQIKFGEPVEWKGQHATVVGVRGDVVDLAIFKPVVDGAGKAKNVVGTAQQTDLVHFEHDVPVADLQMPEDWFFSLSDDDLDALLHERDRRIVKARLEKESEEQAQVQAALTQGVKIRPSDQVMAKAAELWKDSIRAAEHAGEHDEIELPKYEQAPDLWKPWIEQAKQAISAENARITQLPPIRFQPLDGQRQRGTVTGGGPSTAPAGEGHGGGDPGEGSGSGPVN